MLTAWISFSIRPGETALTRTPSPASSLASPTVEALVAPFEAAPDIFARAAEGASMMLVLSRRQFVVASSSALGATTLRAPPRHSQPVLVVIRIATCTGLFWTNLIHEIADCLRHAYASRRQFCPSVVTTAVLSTHLPSREWTTKGETSLDCRAFTGDGHPRRTGAQ